VNDRKNGVSLILPIQANISGYGDIIHIDTRHVNLNDSALAEQNQQ
jgi:hypothetical protein